MKIIDNSGILSDGSIINFNDDGSVEAFLSNLWKKKYRNKKFKYSTKKEAIKIWKEVDKLLFNYSVYLKIYNQLILYNVTHL